MNREEKIERLKEGLGKGMGRAITNDTAARILDYLETMEQPGEIQQEIVLDKEDGTYCPRKWAKDPSSINPEVLACTVGARIPGAKWATVDEDFKMEWYEDEPFSTEWGWDGDVCLDDDGDIYSIYCAVEDWTKAKWRLK